MLQHAKFPANVDFFNQMLVAAKDFEFIKVGDILGDYVYYFPVVEPISLGAQTSGITSTFAAENLGTTQWLAYAFLLGIIVRRVKVCKPYTKKFLSGVHWNGSIRLFVEAYFDFVMFVMIN